jgi:hypothetical protein
VGRDKLGAIGRDFAHLVDNVDPKDKDPISPNEALFVTAAHIAYDPPNYRSVCTPEEQIIWETSRELSFLKQPRALRATVVALCLSALIQGWIQSTLNGSNQTLPNAFSLTNNKNQFVNAKTRWIFSVRKRGAGAVVSGYGSLCNASDNMLIVSIVCH